jgi:hypothetical protein
VCATLPRVGGDVAVATRISGCLAVVGEPGGYIVAMLKHLIEIGQWMRSSSWLDTVDVGTYETSVGLLLNQTAHFCLRTFPEVREILLL